MEPARLTLAILPLYVLTTVCDNCIQIDNVYYIIVTALQKTTQTVKCFDTLYHHERAFRNTTAFHFRKKIKPSAELQD